MDSKLLCLCVVLATIYVANGGGGKCTSGSFNYNGAKCTYQEMGQKNSHERTLRISCDGNKKQKRAPLKCSYKGDPHKEAWYNKNQAAFYLCLKDELVNSKTLCSSTATTVRCGKIPSVIFYLQNHNDALEFERFGNDDVINLESDDSEDIEPFGMLSDDVIGFESFDDDDVSSDVSMDSDDDDQIYRPYV